MRVSDERYDHGAVERRWRQRWRESRLDTPDIVRAKKPFYNLMMFPYPSAEGLHVGNMYAFTGSDIYGRFKRMQGYDVFEPIGLDGFGIHSENYAFKVGKHPVDQAKISQERFYNQLYTIGAMYDWTRTLETYDPNYYRWTQWLFVQMFKHGLAYRGKADVNWCPSCKTVLADEQVIDGACERCGKTVEKRELEQWFFRITAYAEKLLTNSYSLDWSKKVKLAQQQWIGKKEGINITYPVVDRSAKQIGQLTCFTTRPDTNFGATFVAIAPEHPFVSTFINDDIQKYAAHAKMQSGEKRIAVGRKKSGVFTGLYCLNQLNNYKMPLYVSDFVLMEFGTGAVVGVPGHDKRDFEFARAMKLPVIRVVVGKDGDRSAITKLEQVQEESGTMTNSGFLDGAEIHDAIAKMMDYIEKKGWGKRVVTYHLRDWLISRQRYWGPPIPMINCPSCGWQPVPEEDLPVILPRIEDYKPGDDGVAPLAKHKEFYQTSCPKCHGKAVRETDVSDTFLDSSWYYLRYPSVTVGNPKSQFPNPKQIQNTNVQNSKRNRLEFGAWDLELPWDRQVTRRWLPVPMYTGGAEHSVLHLMYSRFVWMALRDWGYLDFSGEAGSRSAGDEPFTTFYAHGLVIKDGAKMSKSKGNTVNPDEYIARYGADALRLYLMFAGPYDQGGDFRDSAMEGMSRWVQRVWRLAIASMRFPVSPRSLLIEKALHKAIKKVGEDIERRCYNTAIAAMMELVNAALDNGGVMTIKELESFLKILAPFAPYMTEELYQRLRAGMFNDQFPNPKQIQNPKSKSLEIGNCPAERDPAPREKLEIPFDSIHFQPWPAYDPKLLQEDTVEIVVQVNGKLRDTITVQSEKCKVQSEVERAAGASASAAKYLEGKTIKKVIFVPGKLVNFVV